MEKTTKGLTCEIYRSRHSNCTLNKFNEKQSVLVPMASGASEPAEDRPAVRIVTRNLFGKEYTHAEPAEKEEGESFAFGGSFIYTCDSRFREQFPYPLPLHDRRMNLENSGAISG